MLDAADAIIAEGGEGPVEVEAVTAMAFLWFARQKCDFAVVETGLGGRYDACLLYTSCWTTLETRKSSLSASILRAPTARGPLPLCHLLSLYLIHILAQNGQDNQQHRCHSTTDQNRQRNAGLFYCCLLYTSCAIVPDAGIPKSRAAITQEVELQPPM